MKTFITFVFTLAVLMTPYGLFAEEVTTVTTTETMGTVSEVSPDTIVVKTETSASPMQYSYTEKTTYVDETGAPVSMETVKSGLPVTVYYTSDGTRMVAEKVVVRKTTTTTETPAPASTIEYKRTTTTTETED
jgi:hypothetical protein